MLLQVALLSKSHATALFFAGVGLVLGVAPQMREVLTQGRDHTGATREVAREDLELPFG